MIRFLVGVILACVAFWIAVPTLLFGVLPGAAGLALVAVKVNQEIVKATAPTPRIERVIEPSSIVAQRPVAAKKPCQLLDGKVYDWCMKQHQGK